MRWTTAKSPARSLNDVTARRSGVERRAGPRRATLNSSATRASECSNGCASRAAGDRHGDGQGPAAIHQRCRDVARSVLKSQEWKAAFHSQTLAAAFDAKKTPIEQCGFLSAAWIIGSPRCRRLMIGPRAASRFRFRAFCMRWRPESFAECCAATPTPRLRCSTKASRSWSTCRRPMVHQANLPTPCGDWGCSGTSCVARRNRTIASSFSGSTNSKITCSRRTPSIWLKCGRTWAAIFGRFLVAAWLLRRDQGRPDRRTSRRFAAHQLRYQTLCCLGRRQNRGVRQFARRKIAPDVHRRFDRRPKPISWTS